MAATLDARQLSTNWLEGTNKRRLVVLSGLMLLLSLVLVRLVLAWDLGSVSAVLIWIALAAVIVQPRYGLYVLFAVILLLEGVRGFDPLMEPGRYLNTSLQESLRLSGAILIPLEMLLLIATALWVAHGVLRRRLDFRAGALGVPVLLFGISLAVGVVRGLMGGAPFNYAFWETRFLFAMALTYIVTANVIRTRNQVRTLSTLVIVFVGLSGIEGVWRKFALADTGALGDVKETWYSHEGVVMWGTLIMLVLAQQVFGAPRWQRIIGPIMLFFTGFTLMVSERRAGHIAVMVAFLAFSVMLARVRPRSFFKLVVPILLVGAIYMPLFWTNTSPIGQPARAVRSIISPDPRDAASNAWRDLEAINVRATIASSPLLGIGFGLPFLQVVAVPSIDFFQFWNYWSHHGILWIWMKGGIFSFITFFAVVNGGIARAVWLVRTQTDRDLRTFVIAGMSALLMSAVFCYVDLGLTGTRVPVLMGVMLGVIGVADRLVETKTTREPVVAAPRFSAY
jgi:hypothetical protein